MWLTGKPSKLSLRGKEAASHTTPPGPGRHQRLPGQQGGRPGDGPPGPRTRPEEPDSASRDREARQVIRSRITFHASRFTPSASP